MDAQAGPTTPMIERRSIDYIPEGERHGTLLSQFTLWVAANLQVTAIVTGALAVVFGGDVFWSLVGLGLGQLLGGAIMALHAAQGPQLGLPQMISSRVQFGVHGAALPIAAVLLMYLGFSASGCVLAGQAMAALLGVDPGAGIALFAAVIVLVTLCGYRIIHALGRLASVLGVLAFLYMFGRLLAGHDVGELLGRRHFTVAGLLTAMSLSASWQIAYGPYVADYSRYLPRRTSGPGVFLAVGLGSVLGAQVAMSFGVLAAALAGKRFEHHEVDWIVGLGSSTALAGLLYFSIAFGKVTVTALNAYGSFMSLATLVSGFRGGMRISRLQRTLYVVVVVTVAALIALAGRHSFLKGFEAFILLLLAVFTPWSAINLVDYYCFTRSRYDVPALFDASGRYGGWNAVGIGIYLLGIAVQVPFLSTPLYTGPLVARLDEVDISWILGLLVPGALYYLLGRESGRRAPPALIGPASDPSG